VGGDRANRLAESLRRVGVQPDAVVGLCMKRSFAMVVGALEILKAGGAYLPVDPGYPQAHLSYILADAKVSVAEGSFFGD
jgi:non-ribosomal peptide synthetase component F